MPPEPTATEAAPPPPCWLDRRSELQMAGLVVGGGLALYLPLAGSYGLFDPWETHYGEVARQMAARGDYISLYWPGSPLDGENFWSKPVLLFWMIAAFMKLFGIGAATPPGALALGSAAEWAVRLPSILMALLALYGVYLPVARFVSRRAGLLAAAALATFPLFSLVARQGMTDMPFVGPMTLALALGALALFDDEDGAPRELPRRRLGPLTIPHSPWFWLTAGATVLLVVPQLVVDGVQLVWRFTWRGKGYTLPGVLVVLPYAAGLLGFLYALTRTRFRQAFHLHLAALLCGLAILAKGLAGLGLPVIVFLAYLAFTWSWGRLGRAGLLRALPFAVLACALVAVPWHHAMLARHGFPFWDELYGDNHWRRLVVGRHGDRGSFEYFLREAAYGILPWVALAPAALAWAAARGRAAIDAARPFARDVVALGAIWFVAGYAVVSLSATKFHHYILPALPGLAIAIGAFVDERLRAPRGRIAALALVAGLPLLALVLHDVARTPKSGQVFVWLFSYDYVNDPAGRVWPAGVDLRPALLATVAAFAAAAVLLVWPRAGRVARWALPGAAVAFTVWLLDVAMPRLANHWSQKPLLAGYYQQRRSPDEPVIAWQMYWRGETFYTQNAIYEGPTDKRTVFLGNRNAEDLQDYLGRNPGRRVFFVVEKTRWDRLRGLLPEKARPSLRVLDERNNKFYLAAADL